MNDVSACAFLNVGRNGEEEEVEVKARCHYRAAKVDGNLYRLGDDVYVAVMMIFLHTSGFDAVKSRVLCSLVCHVNMVATPWYYSIMCFSCASADDPIIIVSYASSMTTAVLCRIFFRVCLPCFRCISGTQLAHVTPPLLRMAAAVKESSLSSRIALQVFCLHDSCDCCYACCYDCFLIRLSA